MNHYLISKKDKIFKINERINLVGGFSFNHNISIHIYNYQMINYILNKKLTNSLKNIINLYLLYDSDTDDEGSDERMESLLPKVELLRKILIESYSIFLSEGEIESYLIKFDKLESKIYRTENKKSRSM